MASLIRPPPSTCSAPCASSGAGISSVAIWQSALFGCGACLAKLENGRCFGALSGIVGGSYGTQGRLRRLPIESVDLLDAGVADKQRSFVRGETAPVSEGSSSRLKLLQAEEALQFAAGDLHAEVAFLVVENPVKIQIARVPGPRRIGHENVGELSPFLRGEIKKQELERIQRNGRDVAPIRGPAGRKQAVGTWEFGGLSSFQIEDVDR